MVLRTDSRLYTQESFLAAFGGLYRISGIEPGPGAFKVHANPAVLSLWRRGMSSSPGSVLVRCVT